VDRIFWIILLVTFLTPVVGGLLRRRKRDKCLKLLHGYPVSYLSLDREPLTGRLNVSSQGIELENISSANFDPNQGISEVVYADELQKCIAICRAVESLTPQQRARRSPEVAKALRVTRMRLAGRWVGSILNTVRDGFMKTLGLIATRSPGAAQAQAAPVDPLTKAAVDVTANAYEPLLERHIGEPVTVHFNFKQADASIHFQIEGNLADYTDTFVTVLAPAAAPLDSKAVELSAGLRSDRIKVQRVRDKWRITGLSPVLLDSVVRSGSPRRLDVILLPEQSIEIAADEQESVQVRVTTPTIDLICSRAVARVRFGRCCAEESTTRVAEQKSRPATRPLPARTGQAALG
jgi:hypothetical protein